MVFSYSRMNSSEEGEDDKNHGVQMDLLPRRLKKIFQQQNSNLRAKSRIDFKPVALVTKAHQHLLEKNYV